MKVKSKKGATMVEAAMIFPLVIAAVAAVLCIVTGLYQSLSLQSSLHMALRNECGLASQTVYRQERMQDFRPEKDREGLRPVIRMEKEREYRINIIFKGHVTRTEKGRAYVIDEAELIRVLSFQREESD